MRVLVQQTFFRAGGGNIVNYLALVLTKLKTEQAKKRARSSEDYFNTKLPVSCIENLEKALHMCLIINEIEPLDVQESISMLGKPLRKGSEQECALKESTMNFNKELYKQREEERAKQAEEVKKIVKAAGNNLPDEAAGKDAEAEDDDADMEEEEEGDDDNNNNNNNNNNNDDDDDDSSN